MYWRELLSRWVVFVAGVGVSMPLFGAVSGGGLSWQDCVELVWQNNPELALEYRDIEASRAQKRAAASGYLPDVSLSATAARSRSTSEISTRTTNATAYIGEARVEVFSGFQTVARVSAAEHGIQKSEAKLSQTKVKLLSDLRRLFAEALFAKENIELSRQIESRLQKNAEFIELRYKGGLEARWTYLKAQADYQEAVWEVGAAQRDYIAAKEKLRAILAISPTEAIDVQGPFQFPHLETVQADSSDPQAFHPNIRFQTQEMKRAQSLIQLEESGFWPTVSLFSRYGFNGKDRFPDQENWSLGAELTLPLFSGFETVASGERAKQEFLRESLRLHQVELETHSARQTALEAYTSATQFIAVTRAQLNALTERAQVVEKEYVMGLMRFLDWEQSQIQLTSAQRQNLRAQRDAMIALADLEKAMGKELPTL